MGKKTLHMKGSLHYLQMKYRLLTADTDCVFTTNQANHYHKKFSANQHKIELYLMVLKPV